MMAFLNCAKRSVSAFGVCGIMIVLLRFVPATSFIMSNYCVSSTSAMASCAVAPSTASENFVIDSRRPSTIALR